MSETVTDHEQLVAGLRAAADFIAAHPELPIPYRVRMFSGAPASLPGEERFAVVRAAAAAMETPPVATHSGGLDARRSFGPVELVVFALSDQRTAEALIGRRTSAGAVA